MRGLGSVGAGISADLAEHGYDPHVRRIREVRRDERSAQRYSARRWMVERTSAWLSTCKAIPMRYGKAQLPRAHPTDLFLSLFSQTSLSFFQIRCY